MELEVSLEFSKHITTNPCPGPNKVNPRPSILLRYSYIVSSYLPQGLPSCIFLYCYPSRLYLHLSSLPSVSRTLHIASFNHLIIRITRIWWGVKSQCFLLCSLLQFSFTSFLCRSRFLPLVPFSPTPTSYIFSLI